MYHFYYGDFLNKSINNDITLILTLCVRHLYRYFIYTCMYFKIYMENKIYCLEILYHSQIIVCSLQIYSFRIKY